ncbi:unnamed protein product (mitochondrion) [Plasmodiophora brassicae]|uniref:Uncharacterized protein n=1 Tax=Plasmodiophora brassicae TaxID=37360 RepID=A0A3P3YPE2_PLABS|nr:unnamed protein product [Plasmodiophora brassicae]
MRDGVYTFRVNGLLYHRIGPVQAFDGQKPRFAQIYFMDPDAQTDRRAAIWAAGRRTLARYRSGGTAGRSRGTCTRPRACWPEI